MYQGIRSLVPSLGTRSRLGILCMEGAHYLACSRCHGYRLTTPHVRFRTSWIAMGKKSTAISGKQPKATPEETASSGI